MRVRQDDVPQLADVAPERAQLREHEPAVPFVERVDQRQLAAAVVDQERVHVPAPGVADAVDAGGELRQAATRRQGAKPFSTPRSAGSSPG